MRLRAVILDWAGTVIDHGSRAPMGAFVRAFAAFGVAIEIEDARGPMGLAKWDHIRAVGQAPRVAAAWLRVHGRAFAEADVQAIFDVFEPMNVASVREHADLIPGAVAAIDALQARGMKIAATTGYTRAILDVVAPLAAAGGYSPSFTVCAGDLPAGRPSPLMMWYAMAKLGVWPAEAVLKVDDTAPGIAEGVAAGTWTVGVGLSGNTAGLTADELASLSTQDRQRLRAAAAATLYAAGADLVIDSVATLPAVVERIEQGLAAGARPRDGLLPGRDRAAGA